MWPQTEHLPPQDLLETSTLQPHQRPPTHTQKSVLRASGDSDAQSRSLTTGRDHDLRSPSMRKGHWAKVRTQPVSLCGNEVSRLSTAVRRPTRPCVAEGSSTHSITQAEQPVFTHVRNTPAPSAWHLTKSSPHAGHPDPPPPPSRLPVPTPRLRALHFSPDSPRIRTARSGGSFLGHSSPYPTHHASVLWRLRTQCEIPSIPKDYSSQ